MKPARLNQSGLIVNGLKRWFVVAMTALLLSAPAWAVELGSPSIRSFLGQSLDVRINVVDGTDENMQGALVSLAPVSEWVRAGITLLPDDVTLQVSFVKEGENIFVALRSQRPIREPVLQVLLSLQVTGQQVATKPFILFLDPVPGAENQPRTISSGSSSARFNRNTAENANNTADNNAANERANNNRASQTASPSPARSVTSRRDPRIDLEGNRYGPVRQGETMWSIAERISRRVDFSPQQILLALQQANPDALEDPSNVNTLRSGVTLTLPDTSSLARTDRDQALALIEEQNRRWRAAGRGARLELVRGGEDTSLGINAGGDGVLALRISRLEEELMAARRENETLRNQVDQLEGALIERESEISVSNQALAEMQRNLAAARALQADNEVPADNDNALSVPSVSTEDSTVVSNDQGGIDFNFDEGLAAAADSGAGLAENNDDMDLAFDRLAQTDNAQALANQLADDQASLDSDTVIDEFAPQGETSGQNNSVINDDNDTQPASAVDENPAAEAGRDLSANNTETGRWTWPLWESAGWREWQRQYSWLPRSGTGFWLLVAIVLTIIALPFIAWLLLRGSGQRQPEESSDLLDRLVTQGQSRKAAAAQSAAAATTVGVLAAEAISAADDQRSDEHRNDASINVENEAELKDLDPGDMSELKPEVVEGIDWEKSAGYTEPYDLTGDSADEPEQLDSQLEASNHNADTAAVETAESSEDSFGSDIDEWSKADGQSESDRDELSGELSYADGSDAETVNTESDAELATSDPIKDVDDDLDLEAALDEALDEDTSLEDLTDIENDPVFNETDGELNTSDSDLLDNIDSTSDVLSLEDIADDDISIESLSDEFSDELDDDLSLADINVEGVDESVSHADITDDLDADSMASDDQPLRLSDADREWSGAADRQVQYDDVDSGNELDIDADNQPQEQTVSDQPEQGQAEDESPISENLSDPFSASLDDDTSDSDITTGQTNAPVQPSLYDDDSIDVKLDLARAYLAMGDREAMLTILDEVGDAGSEQQQKEVQDMRGLSSS